MLILTRKPGQALRIGPASVKLLSIKGRSVKLHLVTDPGVLINAREERKAGSPPEVAEFWLLRYEGEFVRIGREICVTVLAIGRRRVEFGVEAAKGIPVDREEVYLRKVRERQNAAQRSKLT